ncbi:signal transduction histidine kinase [Paenibacillus phyllosphaerae]|uniref:histidine kinase n=1 Tax=Paenibacillus phyllosphaerae TaxID=274593 RepID=A0A7W5B3F9_9BACL|nr:HAMP domain-containing sensor histidine kinase [Paenibacillus phyllosphaerae]MBB3112971.1 signal transduction histidine kinase [Paenibacillus phyllosphaerae]
MKARTIFAKMFFSFMLITFISFGLSSLLSATIFKSNLRDFIRAGSEQMQDHIIERIKYGYGKGWDRETLVDSLEWGMGGPERSYQLYGADGQLLYSLGNRGKPIPLDPQVVQDALSGKRVSEETSSDHTKVLLTAKSIPNAESMDEKVIVSLSFEFERDVNRFVQPYFLSMLITIPLAVAIYFVLGRRLARPLKAMSQTALQYAKGDFSRKVEVNTEDEIGQLGKTLNYMAEELGSLETQRREFLANVSHDLRAPLTSINGFLTALQDGAIPPARQRHYFDMMKESSDRMMKLVGDLLDMARIEAGQFRLEKVRFNLSEQTRKTIARMEPMFAAQRVSVSLNSPAEDIFTVADPDRLDQVLANLLQNAIFYSPAGREVEVTLAERNDATVIVVRDHGVGISQEDLNRIWDRFFKGDKARSRKLGTGIGLSIVKHILDLHDARIEVESELGQGTTFTITMAVSSV